MRRVSSSGVQGEPDLRARGDGGWAGLLVDDACGAMYGSELRGADRDCGAKYGSEIVGDDGGCGAMYGSE